jgi:GNAT superfamily N-acetyltransferase
MAFREKLWNGVGHCEFGMNQPAPQAQDRKIAEAASIRRLGYDDFAAVRHVHAQSFRSLAGPLISETELKAFTDQVYAPTYADALLALETYVALIENQLVGTASWSAGDDSGATARIGAVYVDPLFTRCGIGSRLVTHLEDRAAVAGYRRFAVRATSNAVPFFASLGYEIASHGVSSLTAAEGTLQVTFMRKLAGTTSKTAA